MKISIWILLSFFLMNSACTHLLYSAAGKGGYYVDPERIRPAPRIEKIPVGEKEFVDLWWFTKTNSPKAIVVQFHGNAENLSTHIQLLTWLLDFDYEVVSFDYRGYGVSSDISTSPLTTKQDGAAVLNFVNQKYNGQVPIIVYGQSLGGAVAQSVIADSLLDFKPAFQIYEGSFTSYQDASRGVLSKSWLRFVLSPFVFLVSDSESAKNKMEKINIGPVLVVHSKKDPVIPFGLGEKLFKEIPSEKYFWSLDSDKHLGSFYDKDLGPKRRQDFLSCLGSILGSSSGIAASADLHVERKVNTEKFCNRSE